MKLARVAIAVLAATQLTCNQAILTAPSGSSVSLFANPPFIVSNGGVSVISALVIEPAGTPVPDGTVVQFFTTLGEIEEQGRTNDGVARVNLVAGPLSGVATVSAISGGQAVVGGGDGDGDGGGAAGGTGSASLEVTIGSARPNRMLLSVSAPRLRAPGFVVITANVFDGQGNPVANIPVIFSVAQDDPAEEATEKMERGSAPIFTDNNGRASDELVSERLRNQPAKTVTVTATIAPGGESLLVQTTTVIVD
jgi:hypothetical protein